MSVLASTEPRLANDGSVPAIASMPDTHYKKVRSRKALRTAWRAVYSNGISSDNEDTKSLVKEFSIDIENRLDRIYRRLQEGKFKFLPARGILIPRKGKSPRPIVKSPIPARIVQRAILDVLQSDPSIEPFYKNPASFGGIRGRDLGVPGAIRAVYTAIQSHGANFYIRSDIESFFTNIPRDTVLSKLSSVIPDKKFNSLLSEATRVELDNLAILGSAATFFPSYDIGVAQGCCLSPLLGNVLLEDFDKELNGRGIICIRYIDDFILLGPTERKVEAAFLSGLRILARYGLKAYKPDTGSQKSGMGNVQQGFEFLGCAIRPGMISPSSKSRQRVVEAVRSALDKSQRLLDNPLELMKEDLGAVSTLHDVSNILQGWGNQYAFCNDREALKNLDSIVNRMIEAYWSAVTKRYAKLRNESNIQCSRQLLGVHLLTNSKLDPIIDPLRN